MKIIEMEPYINGTAHLEKVKDQYRIEYSLFDKITDLVKRSNTAEGNLSIYEIPSEYYAVEPDIGAFIPREAKEEMFFALKNGFAVREVPAKCIYLIKKAFNLYKIPNLIFKLIPEKEVNLMFQEGYINGNITLRDVVCNFCEERYAPMSSSKLSTTLGSYSEIYIHSTDMVAYVPLKIKEVLSHEDILALQVDDYGIKLKELYIKFFAGYNGASESNYDLRNLI